MTDKSKKNLYKLKTDGNAFRIAAFGFDKNDVTLYINELSKRFTQMEQEYQEKINRLLNNGAVSTEVKEENSLLQSEQN